MSPDDEEQDVDIVKRQFLQQIPVRHFKWPLSLPSIQELLWEQVSLSRSDADYRSLLHGFTNSLLATATNTSSSATLFPASKRMYDLLQGNTDM